jgi:hypothetical protein
MDTTPLTHRMLSARLRLPVLAFAALAAHPLSRGVAQGAGTPVATPDWDEAAMAADGLTGPNSYQSPHYGYAVEWSGDWRLRTDPPTAPVQTLGDASDRLYLERTAGEAELWFISVADDGRTVQQRYTDATESLPEHTEVVTTLSLGQSVIWVEQRASDDPGASPSVTVNEIRELDGGGALVIYLAAVADELEAAFADVAGVLLDGAPLFSGLQVSVPEG